MLIRILREVDSVASAWNAETGVSAARSRLKAAAAH
jgi:hypothetical protein